MIDFFTNTQCRIPLNNALQKEKYTALIQRYKILLSLWIFTAFLDACSTTLFMSYTGPETEIHLLTKNLARYMGIVSGPITAGMLKILLCMPFLVIADRFASVALGYGIFLQIFATYHNFLIWDSFNRPELWINIIS